MSCLIVTKLAIDKAKYKTTKNMTNMTHFLSLVKGLTLIALVNYIFHNCSQILTKMKIVLLVFEQSWTATSEMPFREKAF